MLRLQCFVFALRHCPELHCLSGNWDRSVVGIIVPNKRLGSEGKGIVFNLAVI